MVKKLDNKEQFPHAKQDIEIGGVLGDGSDLSEIIWSGLNKSFQKYHNKYYGGLNNIHCWRMDLDYNVQRYKSENDGYKIWHTEAGGPPTSNRILVWMIYLNDAKSGTDFMYFPTLKAKEGRCVIWPSAWTHMHKSHPNKGLKYIATGWISYLQ